MEAAFYNKKIAIIGHFDSGSRAADGQTVKTRTMCDLFADTCGKDNVFKIDTCGWSHRPFHLLSECIHAAKEADVLVMLPAQNGIKVFGPLVGFLARRYRCSSVYSVIGGWLPNFIKNRVYLSKCLKGFTSILVESQLMADKLKDQGFLNVNVIYNFKKLSKQRFEKLSKPVHDPYRLIYFARVAKEKGVDDAIWAVAEANRRLGGLYSLDIYGRLLDDYRIEFASILTAASDPLISYKGCVDPSASLSVFEGALALIFPTHYLGEGVPGTIIDSFCAGTPVIASRWPSWSEMISDNYNGLSYEFGRREALLEILLQESLPEQMVDMRSNALESSSKYCYEAGIEAIQSLVKGFSEYYS